MCGDAKQNHITLRCYRVGNITITPYSHIYPWIKYGSAEVHMRGERNKQYEMVCPLDEMNDTEVYIYSADRLSSVGDLSHLNVGLAEFSAATKLQALILGVVLGVIVGAIAAVNQGTWVDSTATVISIIGKSVPNFVLAVLLQYYIGLKLGLFPLAGWGQFSQTIMPTIALAVGPFAETARFIRTSMVDTLSSDYIELGKAKGLSRMEVIRKHAMRNSMIPLVTLIGPYAVALMTGSMVIENIFNIPGIGEQFVKSILTNDYPTIMGITMVYCIGLVVILLVTDIVYGLIDPRIRLDESEA